MSLAPILIRERGSFLQPAWLGILVGMHDAWRRARPPHEPDIVASLVLESIPLIADAWRTLLRRHQVALSVAAVYCHQTPKVTYPTMQHKSCELGDLLFVHVHTDQAGQVARNAILFQAKMSSKQPYSVAPAERDQLGLYVGWPTFEYVTAGKTLNGQRRDISPKSAHSGAQYLLIDDRPPRSPASGLLGIPGTHPIGVCMPDPVLIDHGELASELIRFLGNQTGRVFDDRAHAAHDAWTAVVWDLLQVGLTKAFNRQRSGHASVSRIAGRGLDAFDGATVARASSSRPLTTAVEVLGPRRTMALYEVEGGEPPSRNALGVDNDDVDDDGVSIVLLETHAAAE